MNYIFCDNEKCINNKDGECKLDSTTISDEGNCMSVEYDEVGEK